MTYRIRVEKYGELKSTLIYSSIPKNNLRGMSYPRNPLILCPFRNGITSDDGVDLSTLAGVLPPVETSEYFLRALVPRPGELSRPTPQSLYCCIKRGEFRLAGAFTVDKHLM